MFIIAGLGNPGERFNGTRHNIGFYVIDLLAQKFSIPLNKAKHKAIVGEGRIGDEKVILAKPQTFMNLSGQSLMDLRDFYKTQDNQIIIVYDDIDLEPGVLRVRPFGSAGTHNGMRSVILQLQNQDFPRVRIGVGRPPDGWDLADFVLSRFKDEEVEPVKEACDRAVKGIELIVLSGLQEAMSRFNG